VKITILCKKIPCLHDRRMLWPNLSSFLIASEFSCFPTCKFLEGRANQIKQTNTRTDNSTNQMAISCAHGGKRIDKERTLLCVPLGSVSLHGKIVACLMSMALSNKFAHQSNVWLHCYCTHLVSIEKNVYPCP